MAVKKENIVETSKEYIIPLRREWMKVVRYKRTFRAVNTIKKYIAKHMKVDDRNVNSVKLDVYLNNELWFRGGKKPPAKIKVKAIRSGDIVRVELVDLPDKWKFAKTREDKIHKKVDKKKKVEEKKEEVKTEEEKKIEEEKKEEEKEKSTSSAKAQEQAMDKMAKVQKHTQFKKPDKAPLQRKSLKK
jgi:large subunit ribosomal protein L31e